MGRNSEPDRQIGTRGARDRGHRRRGRTDMREHDSGETSRQRMNKKKLPKAVLRTADQMREAAAERSQDAAHPVDLNETPAARPAVTRTAERAANGNVIEMMPKA